MRKNVNAVALRGFNHADDSFEKNEVILGMSGGHFDDWSADGVDFVRAATDAEVKRAQAAAEKAADKPATA